MSRPLNCAYLTDALFFVPAVIIICSYLGLAKASVVVLHFQLAFSCPKWQSSVFGCGTSRWGRWRAGFLFWEALMGKKLYVGNLTYGVTDSTLLQMFEPHGTEQSAQVI